MMDTERTERAREKLRQAEAEAVNKARANGHAEDYAKAKSLHLLLWHQIDDAGSTDRLVKGIIGEESLAAIAGPSGSGKSFLALGLSIHLAAGWQWFGHKVTRCGVLYVGAEGQAGLKKRILAAKIKYELKEKDLPFALYPHALDLVADSKGADAIVERVELLRKITGIQVWLVVIDTLARCFGDGDENAAMDMNKFARTCQRIQTKARAAILIVHHTGKDADRGMRGSSAFRGAVDTVIIVAGTEGTRTATIDKQKDGQTGEPFAFNLKPVDLGVDEDGDPITSCVVVPCDAPAPNSGKGRRPLSAECLTSLDYLKDVVADHGQIVAMNGMPANTKAVHLDVWRDYLKQRGLHEGGEAGKKWFQRTRGKLIAEKRIAVNDPYVWIVK